MKVTFVEIIKTHTALDRRKYCSNCGEHQYSIVEQIEPVVNHKWSVRCPECGHETNQYLLKDGALARWKEE